MGNMSPVVFPFKQWELVAAAGKEGVIYLLDAKSMGGADHRTPLYRSPLLTNEDVNLAGRGFWGAFATWEDPQGTRWLYAPAWGPPHSQAPAFAMTNGAAAHGSIMAFKVEEKDGKPVLDAGVDFARHGRAGAAGSGERHGVCALERGEHAAARQLGADPEQPRPGDEAFRERRAVCAGRGNGEGTFQ